MTAAERRDAARSEIEKALRAGPLPFRARREIEAALREVGQRRGHPIRRLDRTARHVSPLVAAHLAAASGHLRRPER